MMFHDTENIYYLNKVFAWGMALQEDLAFIIISSYTVFLMMAFAILIKRVGLNAIFLPRMIAVQNSQSGEFYAKSREPVKETVNES
jgi:hypothetical protein